MVHQRISQGSRLVLRYLKLTFLLGVIVLSLMLSPNVRASPVAVTVAPASQVVSQYGVTAYTVTVSAPVADGDQYSLSLSGISSSQSLFSPNPVPVPLVGSVPSTLTINVGANDICPGTYTFSVTATRVAGGDSASSNTFSMTVTPAGPPLQASVTTNKPSYRLNDKVTILMNVNKPAYARLTIQPPTGTPKVFGVYAIYGSSSKTLTADTVGRWSVTFEAEICSEFSSAVAYFDVAPDTYDVSILLSGIPASVSVGLNVDGTSQGTMGGSEIKKLSFKVDTQHMISLDQYVTGEEGVRYYCAQNTWNVGSGGSRTFDYETQYQFTVATDPDGVTQVTGGGWFKAGTVVQTGQVSDTVTGSPGTRYVLKGWKVDGVLQTSNPVSLTMDKPHKATATYETQYQLLVDSPYGDPKGAGYYAAGSTATFSVTTPVGFLIQQVFVEWNGDYTGSSPSASVAMDKPKVVHAAWTTSYTQLYIVLAGVAAVVVVGVFLLWRRRRGPLPEMKPTPPVPGEAEVGEALPSESGGTTAESRATDSRKCSSCGNDVPVGQTFCHNCGAKMS